MSIISVYYDDEPLNPRHDYSNFSHFALGHNRYDVGDKDTISDLRTLIMEHPNFRKEYHYDYNLNALPDLEALGLEMDVFAIHMPVYGYEHGDLAVSLSRTGQFADQFDSGKLGFIYVTKQDIRDNFGKKYVTKALIERSKSVILGEFEEYKSFIEGNTFGFSVYADESKEGVEDCMHGFIGDDLEKNGMLEHVKEELHDQLKQIFEYRDFEPA